MTNLLWVMGTTLHTLEAKEYPSKNLKVYIPEK